MLAFFRLSNLRRKCQTTMKRCVNVPKSPPTVWIKSKAAVTNLLSCFSFWETEPLDSKLDQHIILFRLWYNSPLFFIHLTHKWWFYLPLKQKETVIECSALYLSWCYQPSIPPTFPMIPCLPPVTMWSGSIRAAARLERMQVNTAGRIRTLCSHLPFITHRSKELACALSCKSGCLASHYVTGGRI